MSKAFNFYQYGESGAGEFITPFPSLFTGFYFPQDLAAGGAIGFAWRLFDDDLLRPAKIQIRITGQESAGYNLSQTISFAISGNVFPSLQDSGEYSMSYTGQVKSGDYDSATLDPSFTGKIQSGTIDLNDLNLSFSGQVATGINERATFGLQWTGSQVSGWNIAHDFTFSFRGDFIKKNKDIVNLDLVFTQVSFNVGAATITMSTGDRANIDLVFSSATFKQA